MDEHIFTRTAATGSALDRRSQSETFREFLRRQFRGDATGAQTISDITIGMVLPVLCLVFDPILFREGIMGGQPMAERFQLFAYGFIAIQIVALAAWLAIGRRAGEWCGVLGGMMLAGVLFSLGVGLLLLPFSLLGLVVLIGALGFTPFLTGFIYLRNARRALGAAGAQMTRAGLVVTLLFGATLALGAPAFAHWRINKLIEHSLVEVIEGDDSRADAAVRRLRHVSWFDSGQFNRVVSAYGRTTDPVRKERLTRDYYKITGDNIEHRLRVIYD